jgi:hypothetical protein
LAQISPRPVLWAGVGACRDLAPPFVLKLGRGLDWITWQYESPLHSGSSSTRS